MLAALVIGDIAIALFDSRVLNTCVGCLSITPSPFRIVKVGWLYQNDNGITKYSFHYDLAKIKERKSKKMAKTR